MIKYVLYADIAGYGLIECNCQTLTEAITMCANSNKALVDCAAYLSFLVDSIISDFCYYIANLTDSVEILQCCYITLWKFDAIFNNCDDEYIKARIRMYRQDILDAMNDTVSNPS